MRKEISQVVCEHMRTNIIKQFTTTYTKCPTYQMPVESVTKQFSTKNIVILTVFGVFNKNIFKTFAAFTSHQHVQVYNKFWTTNLCNPIQAKERGMMTRSKRENGYCPSSWQHLSRYWEAICKYSSSKCWIREPAAYKVTGMPSNTESKKK